MKIFYRTAIIEGFMFICSNEIIAQTVKSGSPEQVEYNKMSQVRIFISDPSDIIELRRQGLGFESLKMNDKSFDFIFDSYWK